MGEREECHDIPSFFFDCLRTRVSSNDDEVSGARNAQIFVEVSVRSEQLKIAYPSVDVSPDISISLRFNCNKI